MTDSLEHGLLVPRPWADSPEAQQELGGALRDAAHPLLICDYDGTLAPFHVDKMEARPYPGVVERLERILQGRTQLAFVSGRPVGELMMLLPLAARTEIWGMHGREHRRPDGGTTLLDASQLQRAALNEAQHTLATRGVGDMLERKAASLAVHWRGLEAGGRERIDAVQALAGEVFAGYAGRHALAILQFDGGMELRAEDYTKGHAVQALLGETSKAPVVFLGDDTTDEDAFRVVGGARGLSLLVREPPRPSHANFSLRPPADLLGFFDFWLSILADTGSEGNESYTRE